MTSTTATPSRDRLERCLERIADPAYEGARAYTKVYAETARAEADYSDALQRAGVVRSPIDGLPVSVKDLFDVGGDVTRAGSKVLAHAAPAERDATAVARLRAAGAVIIGRTNMVEFAFGVVGANPHYGTPRNPFDRGIGRVPGGSKNQEHRQWARFPSRRQASRRQHSHREQRSRRC